jgi:hypothetical protein
MESIWLHTSFGRAFMGVDTWCTAFKTYEQADAWIKEVYGFSHSEIMDARDVIQEWFDNSFQGDIEYDEKFCVKVFGDDQQEIWDEMCDQGQVEMPYGLKELKFEEPCMVTAQGSF